MNRRSAMAVQRMTAQRFPMEPVQTTHASIQAEISRITESCAVPRDSFSLKHFVPPSRRQLVPFVSILAVALIALILAGPLVWGSTSYAATPNLLRYQASQTREDPTSILQQLADRASRQPALPDARYDYIRTRAWYLATDQTTDGQVISSRIEPSDREVWIAPDGSGRIQDTRGGTLMRWSGDYTAGHLSTPLKANGTATDIGTELRQQGAHRSTVAWFDAVKQLWATQVVPPTMQSALLQILATQPDVNVAGTVTDRAGRQGIAVSTESPTPRMKYVLVLDENTGMLLDFEEVAVEEGSLPVKSPATIGYTVWLSTGRVPTTGDRP